MCLAALTGCHACWLDRCDQRPYLQGSISDKHAYDQASKQLLEGATLDYKDGLNQAGFSITNPNATRTCGCGSSFS